MYLSGHLISRSHSANKDKFPLSVYTHIQRYTFTWFTTKLEQVDELIKEYLFEKREISTIFCMHIALLVEGVIIRPAMPVAQRLLGVSVDSVFENKIMSQWRHQWICLLGFVDSRIFNGELA